ncbi:hypothetical protein MHC_05105 [Mycoplasma haemocanis str. Illinois]|uniref:Uncharacterized protein n=1 Tax=Mycoplasma haemocanis (strain Illinois) TaxID=1111676 RepID=H6N8A5_MYCHN|nr:hypothetical protein [Mycoplasma haemocanis]AEW45877.1 hypothetical protein MHC_05105 [Mycoplasma haemocanis str. Illinois]
MIWNNKLLFALLGISGAGTTLFLLSNYTQTDNRRETFSTQIDTKYLLKTSDTKQWKERVVDLKALLTAHDSLVPLKLKKRGNDLQEKDLQEWCDYALNNSFHGKQDPSFLMFVIFCTYNLGDKIMGNKITKSTSKDDSKLNTIWNKIAALKPNTEMSTELLKVRLTVNPQNNHAGNEAVKNWCLSMYETPYWESEQYLSEVQEHCILE